MQNRVLILLFYSFAIYQSKVFVFDKHLRTNKHKNLIHAQYEQQTFSRISYEIT